jgi:Na+-driven multidrug efflux pump
MVSVSCCFTAVFFYGGQYDKMLQYVRFLTGYSMLICFAITVLGWPWLNTIYEQYTQDEAVLELLQENSSMVATYYLLDTLKYVLLGAVRGTNQQKLGAIQTAVC